MRGNRSSKTRGVTWYDACPARRRSSMFRKARTERGESQRVIKNVRAVALSASMPTGTSKRCRPMPSALMAISSLSADNRPRAMSAPTRTPMGIVKLRMPGNVERNRMPMSDQEPGCRTTRSIKRTSCGTKKTNVKMPSPKNEWEKIWRQMYRSIKRIDSGRHSSTPGIGSLAGLAAPATYDAGNAARTEINMRIGAR